MAWGRNLEKKDLVEAGFDVDGINDKIKNAATKEDVDAIKTSVETFTNSLKSLETKLTEGLATVSRGNEGGGGNGGERREEHSEGGSGKPTGNTDPLAGVDPITFMEDPMKYAKAVAQQAVTGVQIHSLNIACEMAYNQAKQNLPHFVMLEDEIKKEWDLFPVTAKGQDPMKLITNLYNMVKGRHLDEILTDTAKKEGKFNIVKTGGTSYVPPGGNNNQNNKDVELTADEKITAKKWGVTEEAYKKTKETMRYV